MNEFTKEELENILLHMEISVGEDIHDEFSINIPGLYLKIKEMIDNYCEHEWENPCCGCPDSACICTKCGSKL